MAAVWKTDTEMVDLVGPGWLDDMEDLWHCAADGGPGSPVECVQVANDYLRSISMDQKYKVIECKSVSPAIEEDMHWLVEISG